MEGEDRRLVERLPEDAVVSFELELVGYITADDPELQYGVQVRGDVPLSTLLGHLELAKEGLIRASREEAE